MPDGITFLDTQAFKEKASETPDEIRSYGIRKQFIPDEVKQQGDKDSRIFRFTISTDAVDRDKDTIAVKGWKLKHFRKNPVVLFAHDSRQPPIGRAVKIFTEDGKLKADAEFMTLDTDISGRSEMIFRMIRDGFLKTTSVGFIPEKFEFVDEEEEGNEGRRFGINFLKQELLEFSIVPVPANPEAFIEARSKGIDIEPLIEMCEEVVAHWEETKSGLVMPKDDYEELAENIMKACDATLPKQRKKIKHLSNAEQEDLAKKNLERIKDNGVDPDPTASVSAQTDPNPTPGIEVTVIPAIVPVVIIEDLSEEKTVEQLAKDLFDLPDNLPDGADPSSFGSVASGMAKLLGGSGGVEVEDADRKGLHDYLTDFYLEFEKEAPEFRYVEDQVLAADFKLAGDFMFFAFDFETGQLMVRDLMTRMIPANRLEFDGYSETDLIKNSGSGEDEDTFEIQSLVYLKSSWATLEDVENSTIPLAFKFGEIKETASAWRIQQQDADEFVVLRDICINPGDVAPTDGSRRITATGGPKKATAIAKADDLDDGRTDLNLPRRRSLKIVSDGSINGTSVVDAETGETIEGVTRVEFVADVKEGMVKASFDIILTAFDIELTGTFADGTLTFDRKTTDSDSADEEETEEENQDRVDDDPEVDSQEDTEDGDEIIAILEDEDPEDVPEEDDPQDSEIIPEDEVEAAVASALNEMLPDMLRNVVRDSLGKVSGRID